MSHESPVSMRELELESAELLPARETLCVTKFHPAHCSGHSYGSGHSGYSSSSSYSVTQTGYGNTAQAGLVNISVANGSLDNILSLGSGNIW